MTRPTVSSLITEGLGYCCPWFFFTHYRQVPLIAARLGVTERAVQYAKAKVVDGTCVCANHPNCMNRVITQEGSLRKRV